MFMALMSMSVSMETPLMDLDIAIRDLYEDLEE